MKKRDLINVIVKKKKISRAKLLNKNKLSKLNFIPL